MARAVSLNLNGKLSRLDAALAADGYPCVMLTVDIAKALRCSHGHVYRLVRQRAFITLSERPHNGKPVRVERREIARYLLMKS